jgi:anti-sigma factor ChrR (cupin superfamily)
MAMNINADFSRLAIVDRSKTHWIASPAPGVERIMLDRIGDEVARATSIVRYAPGSSFARHEHAKGEEFLVLEGVFSDESGDYPTGCYVRNPPGSGHAPFSKDGCRILVKLRQFDPQDLAPVVIDTERAQEWQSGDGVDTLPLHSYGSEQVDMVRIAAGREYSVAANPGGVEILVVSGAVRYGDDYLCAESWLRFPPPHAASLTIVGDCLLWRKRGHVPL